MNYKSMILTAIVAASVCAQGVTVASTISIDFTGVDIEFDGTDLTDAGAPADELDTVSIIASSGTSSTSFFTTSDIDIDFIFPDVDPIPVSGGSVSTGDTGSLTLNLPGSDFLSLELGTGTVTFVDVGGIAQFAFAATVADAGSTTQSLPSGLLIGDPITVSFQTSVTSLASSGGFVDSFTGSGTGSIDGALVPEPSTAVLVLTMTAGALASRRRR